MENVAISDETVYDYEDLGPILADKGLVEGRVLTIEDLTEEVARELYFTHKKSFREIARMFNSTTDTERKKVSYRCNSWNIKPRPKGEEGFFLISKEELEKLYFIENKSFQDIADMKNVGLKAIRHAFRRHNLKLKPKDSYGQKLIKIEIKDSDIIHLYVNEKKTLTEVAQTLNVSTTLVVDRLTKNNIVRRKFTDYGYNTCAINQRIRTDRKNIELKKEVMKRDNYRCVKCNADKNLEIDHIIPLSFIIKKNDIKTFDEALLCDDVWDLNNLRVLCIKCHMETDTWGVGARLYLKENLNNQ